MCVWGGGGGGGHRCNINFSNGQSIGIVLYGMCSHSLYIKGENWQKLMQQLYANHMHILISWRQHTQSFKSVRGVALTANTHCLYIQGEKWLSLQCLKSDKNYSNKYVQSTCTSSYHKENTSKVSKQLVQNCKRSCAHNKYPLSIYSGWKMTKFTMPKKWQKLIQQLCPIHMHILIPWGKHMQSLKKIGTKL